MIQALAALAPQLGKFAGMASGFSNLLNGGPQQFSAPTMPGATLPGGPGLSGGAPVQSQGILDNIRKLSDPTHVEKLSVAAATKHGPAPELPPVPGATPGFNPAAAPGPAPATPGFDPQQTAALAANSAVNNTNAGFHFPGASMGARPGGPVQSSLLPMGMTRTAPKPTLSQLLGR